MKTFLMKGLISILVVTGMVGCSFDNARRYEPTFNQVIYMVESHTDSSQVTETHTTAPQRAPQVIIKTLPVPPVRPPATSPITEQTTPLPCRLFILPNALQQPLPPKFEDPTLKNADLDTMMGDYIKALRAHIIRERTNLEDAHRVWLQGCDR